MSHEVPVETVEQTPDCTLWPLGRDGRPGKGRRGMEERGRVEKGRNGMAWEVKCGRLKGFVLPKVITSVRLLSTRWGCFPMSVAWWLLAVRLSLSVICVSAAGA